eukprot:675346-Prymnesium_polylepis.1
MLAPTKLLHALLAIHPARASLWRPATQRQALLGRCGGSLGASAGQLRESLVGRDIDLDRLEKATRAYCELIRAWGLFTAPSISQ